MSVIKKQFTWKFGYPRFQKKLKLNYEKEEGDIERPGEEIAWDETGSCSSLVVTAASESVCWDFGGKSKSGVNKVKSTVTEVQESEPELDTERIYSNLVELTQDPIYENQRPEDVEKEHLYENANSEEPVYENCKDSVSEEDKEHIYEHVSCQSPVNIFVGLLQSEAETISPDPNIYEVPPGAIFNKSIGNVEEPFTRKVKPPEGFQDYENVCWDAQGGFGEELFALPVEVIYSTVVKPKRKKCRPRISVMLHEGKNASFNGVEGGTSNEMSNVTDNNNINSFPETGSAEKHANKANCEASCEHSSNHILERNNDTPSEDIKIDSKMDNSVVTLGDNFEDTKLEDSVASCGDTSCNTNINSCITLPEVNLIDIEIDNCIDPYKNESIKISADNCIASSEDKTIDTEADDCIDSCGDAEVNKCVDSVEAKVDINVASCGETKNIIEYHSIKTPCKDNSMDTKVDICITSCGDNSNYSKTHNSIASCEENLIDTKIDNNVVSCEDSSNDIKIDKCLPTHDCNENESITHFCGDSPNESAIVEVLNDISDSVDEEFSESALRREENTGHGSGSKVCDTSESELKNAEDVDSEEASVIEISDDGTWETKTLPPAELGQAKQEDESHSVEEPEFLCAVDRSAETVKMTYGSQYYVNCPVASVKPMKHDAASGVDDEAYRNIGAQIMKKYEEERQKLRENLPDVSLLDVDASLEDIQRERRRIIENQTVRAKRIDSWVKNGEMPDDLLDLENLPSIDSKILEVPSPSFDIVRKISDMETCDTSNNAPKLPAEGEVVYDSIIQNKHKTKSYWEQLMMAAATSDQPRVPYKRDLLSLGSDGEDGKPSSDVSEQEYYDARSQISIHSPAEPLDSLDQTFDLVSSGPKIVETVAKKLMEAENVKLNKSVGEESVIEREIRLQREREEALAREREAALVTVATVPPVQVVETSSPTPSVCAVTPTTPSPNAAETKIALELREMREREEELRRLRQRLIKEEADDGFNSIPNTDEGNFSEYGSEEKELSLDGNNSRMMSPEVPTGPGTFLHQRTQSMDSMSSGHSSGSSSGNVDMIVGRRRVTVKPLDEPEDDEIPTYMMRGRRSINSTTDTSIIQRDTTRNQKETPIEREIRLTREREEELRREKGLPPQNSQSSPTAGKQEVRRINNRNALANDPRSVQHRIATSRIQQEIDEATEREKELREAGMIQTTSEETVDSKVTRFTDLAEFAIEERDRKLHKSVSTSHIPQLVDETDAQASPSITPPQKIQNNIGSATGRSNIGWTMSQSPSTPTLSPRKFPTTMGQKGLMQRFLATRGKMGTLSSGFVTSPTSPNSNPNPVPIQTTKLVDTSLEERQNSQENDERENGDVQRTVLRRGYISAEEKIHVELQEMQKREEELRLQRARTFARSQPNLLCLGDDEEDESQTTNRDAENHASLRGALSNPNLLDSETSPNGDSDSSLEKPSFKNIRKRSALIAQWENMIQQNIEH